MTIKEAVDNFGHEVVEAAMRNLGATRTVGGKKRRAVASGKLKGSLTFKNQTRYGKPMILFTTNDEETKKYADVVEFGREAGARMPPVEPIIEWMKIKPIRLRSKDGGFIKNTEDGIRSAAFAIARSISRKGIKPLFYYTEAIESVINDPRTDEMFTLALEKEIEIKLNLQNR